MNIQRLCTECGGAGMAEFWLEKSVDALFGF